MKKKLVLVLGIVLLIFATLAAEIPAFEVGEKDIEVTLSNTFVSRYIWRGHDVYSDNDAAYQPSVDISIPEFIFDSDLSLNIWGAFPLHEGHETVTELDYTLTFARTIADMLDISLGYTYFDYPKANDKSDVQEPWAAITLNKIPSLPLDVSFTVFAGYDYEVTSSGPEEGWYYSWGFDTELLLPKVVIFQDGQSLAVGITNWGNDGVAGLKPSSFYATEIGLSTSYAFKSFSVTPSINYTINYEDEINSGEDEIWTGMDISYIF